MELQGRRPFSAKQTGQGLALHLVVEPGRGAVQVDVVKVGGAEPGLAQRHGHRGFGPDPLRMRGRDVPGIGGFTGTEQGQFGVLPGQQEEGGPPRC